MYFNLNKLDTKYQQKILALYNKGESWANILATFHLESHELAGLLAKENISAQKIGINLMDAIINEHQVIVIADTHIGSSYDNFDYIYMVYEFARTHNIHTILHLGDMVNSLIGQGKIYLPTIATQVDKIINKWPKEEGIACYLLGGNHELDALKRDNSFMDLFTVREDFNFLGFKKAYVLIDHCPISLNHKVKNYRITLPYLNCLINLFGHRHELLVTTGLDIYAPTLSDNFFNHFGWSEPGFLVLDFQARQMIATYYSVCPKLTNQGPILTKNINKKVRRN